jgi:hypothetical protein
MPDDHQWQIEDLIHRRTDLSTFVIHWTRDFESRAARENLISMLQERRIVACNPMGAAARRLEQEPDGPGREAALDSQKVVCFTEAPLEQAWSFVVPVFGRQTQLEPYGLAFTKRRARLLGINPVWYVDMTPGHTWLMNDIETLVERAIRSALSSFDKDPIARIAPFVEGMGTWGSSRKEFWWEREWRCTGDLKFRLQHVAVILCPENDMGDFRKVAGSAPPEAGRRVPLVDPRWGLEQIIAALADVPEDDRRSV